MLSTAWPSISRYPQASDFISCPFCHRISRELKQYNRSRLLPKLPLFLMFPPLYLYNILFLLQSLGRK